MTIKSPLINASELKAILGSPNTVLIDARSGPDAFQRYESGHPEGARHADLDRNLAQKPIDPAKGGRHPLPAIKTFSLLLGKLDITPSTQVIVYDDKNGANAAARFWWMLKAVGHQHVQVVNGGLSAITSENIPLTKKIPDGRSTPPYPVSEWKLPTATIEKVASVNSDPEHLIIDVREKYRYCGESEPIDLTAGHIPGAANIPYLNNLDKDGKFLSPEQLRNQFRSFIKDRKPENVIVHCGSGVTACHTLLAMESAGITGCSLYVGSWSEWSRTGREIATGDNP
jgi:thiosulfate/3-mercaptopyruvate sulfurtransferase